MCLLCFVSRSQDYVINLRHWGLEDGLSDRLIYSIFEDSKGFIWIGTRNGLDRFDGYKFINYRIDPSGLSSNMVTRIMEDKNGILWLRDVDAKILLFDPLSTKMMPAPHELAEIKINHFKQLPDGRIFIVSRDQQHFYLFDNSTKKLTEIALPEPGGVFFLVRADSSSFWITKWKEKKLYQLDWNGRVLKSVHIFQAQPSYWDPVCFPWYDGICERIMEKDNPLRGKTFLLQENGFEKDISYQLSSFDSRSVDQVIPIQVDSIVWRQGKLFHPTKGVLRDFASEGISDLGSLLRCYLRDKKGNIWIGNNFGLYRLSVVRNKFQRYFYNPSFKYDNHNSYRNILALDGIIYAVNEEKGLLSESLGWPADFPHYKDLTAANKPTNYSYAATLTDSQHIYHINAKQFYSIQLSGKLLRSYQVKGLNSSCRSMTEIQPGKWLLGLDQGFLWFNPATGIARPFGSYNNYKDLAKQAIYQLLPEERGYYWVCSSNGLYCLDAEKGIMERFSSNDSGAHYLPVSVVYDIYQDKESIYWLATDNGLLRWNKDNHRYLLFNRASGLSNDKIYAVYEDNYDRLWLSSDYGIMSMDKKTGFIKSYLEKDGITYREFNSASHFKDAGGHIYFGSLNGVTAFDPTDFPRTGSRKENSLVITSVIQFDRRSNKKLDNTASVIRFKKIKLLPSQNFVIEFAMLNFSETEKTTYYWKINEMDSSWHSQTERVLRFETLPYGKKTLRLKAIATDGTASNELVIKIDAVAPLYLRWWFLILAVLVVLTSAFFFYRWRVQQLRKKNIQLDRVVQEKTKDLQVSLRQKDLLMREIHHRVKNNLQVISTLLELQLAEITDENAKKALQESQTRVRSIALVHQQLYQKEDIITIEIAGFVKDLFDQLRNIYNKKGQEISLKNQISTSFLDIDTTIPLGLILNELMTNSYKYAFARHHGYIEVNVWRQNEYYVLSYSDSGPGLPPDYDLKKSKTLGLSVVHSLSHQLGGSFEYKDNRFIIYFKDEAGRKMEE